MCVAPQSIDKDNKNGMFIEFAYRNYMYNFSCGSVAIIDALRSFATLKATLTLLLNSPNSHMHP